MKLTSALQLVTCISMCLSNVYTKNLQCRSFTRCYRLKASSCELVQMKMKRLECVFLCSAKRECKQIFYNMKSHQCKLCDYRHDQKKSDNSKGWHCYIVNECADAILSENSVHHNISKHACPTDFRLPRILHTVCNPYRVETSFRCERFRWNGAFIHKRQQRKTWFKGDLPHQDDCVNGNRHVKIKATPIKEGRVQFYYKKGDDRLCRFDIRFQYGSNQHELVIDTRMGGRWLKKNELEGFPFEVNKTFLADFVLKDGTYKVNVGKHSWSYKEKTPGVEPEGIDVRDDVWIDYVEVVT